MAIMKCIQKIALTFLILETVSILAMSLIVSQPLIEQNVKLANIILMVVTTVVMNVILDNS